MTNTIVSVRTGLDYRTPSWYLVQNCNFLARRILTPDNYYNSHFTDEKIKIETEKQFI
jgi:hypothetical protein